MSPGIRSRRRSGVIGETRRTGGGRLSTAEELERLVALLDRGVLSEEEFQAEKARLLGQSSAEGPSEAPSPTEPISTQPSSSEEQTSPRLGSSAGLAVTPTGSPVPTGGSDREQQQGSFVLTGKQVLIGLLILVVIAAGAGLGIALTGSNTPASASEVFLQPSNAQGQNPFTPNVGKNAPATAKTAAALTPSSGTNLASYTGNSIGLYGGTLDTSSCNPGQMVAYLEANPQKASAWAAAEGIPVSQVPTYINGLTPMTLRYDTRVTNHGYVNGQANAIPEILQAGQAVLVDSHGVPRARCYCGNPLTPPAAVSGTPQYTGVQWTGFSPTTTIVVTQSTTIINNFTLINNSTGQAFSRPTGTTGTSDSPTPSCTAGGPSMPGVTACTATTTKCLTGNGFASLSCLDAAVQAADRAGAHLSHAVANCGPADANLSNGAYVACGLTSTSVGSATEVVLIGPTPPGFTVTWSPSSSVPCNQLNAGELAAFEAYPDLGGCVNYSANAGNTGTPTTTMATTTTTAAPPASQITIASLDATIAQQANAAPPSPGQPPGSWTVTCGPPSASLAVGSDILCDSVNPAFGDSLEVIQITGSTPSSFTVVAGPGTSFPCSSLNAAEQAAFTADGNSCTPG